MKEGDLGLVAHGKQKASRNEKSVCQGNRWPRAVFEISHVAGEFCKCGDMSLDPRQTTVTDCTVFCSEKFILHYRVHRDLKP